MKRIIITIFFLLSASTFAHSQDIFNSKIDSLLNRMSELIINDLKNDSIKLTPRPWIGLGDSFELNVIFDSKD